MSAAHHAAMGVAVYGLLRSGTTLVADLLTTPGRSLVISEPDLFVTWDDGLVTRIHSIARNFGLDVPDSPPARAEYGTLARYFEVVLIPRLRELDLWGIKQVQFLFWKELFSLLPPKKLVICVRDLRDIALSAFELIGRMGLVFGYRQVLRDEAWVLVRLCHDIFELHRMSALPHFRVRYEDLVHNDNARGLLAEYVSLNCLGETRLNLASEPATRSSWELSKHDSGITSGAGRRFEAEPPGPARSLAERIWTIQAGYSRHFGYQSPGPGVAIEHHSLSCSSDTGLNPVSQPLLGWGAELPQEYEVAYARRHARIEAVKLIPPGSAVLDLGCVVPALRLLLPRGCRYQGSDLKRRYDGCIVANYHAGELPPAGDATIITVLGLLEYIDDTSGFVRRLRTYGRPVILTYHLKDDSVGISRKAFGWRNNFSCPDLHAMLRAAGFDCKYERKFFSRQTMFYLVPV